MNDIILPFTCKTKDKLITIIHWSMRVFFPLLALSNLFYFSMPTLVMGAGFSFLIWFVSLVMWDSEGKLPNFRCKCEDMTWFTSLVLWDSNGKIPNFRCKCEESE